MMNSKHLICMLLLAGVSLPVVAEVGDLKPVAVDPYQGVFMSPVWIHDQESFTKSKDGDGTVNKKARIVAIPFKEGGIVFYAAIDSRDPNATKPDVIRYDLTGQAKFDDEHIIPSSGPGEWLQFGPATLMVPVNEKTSIPVQVQGQYYRNGKERYLQMSLGTALEGECAFGDKTYPVQLVDCTSNLSCTDPANSESRRPTGDMVFVGDGVKLPTPAREGKGYFFGQPIPVDGKWYELKVSEDLKISATPVEVETTKAHIPHENWLIVLQGKKHLLQISGGKEPFEIPVDTYTIYFYRQSGAATIFYETQNGVTHAPHAQFMCYRDNATKPIEIKPGEVNEITVGTPLVGKMTAEVVGNRQVNLSFGTTDAAGMRVVGISSASGRQEPPSFEIYDEAGNKVHGGAMQYG